jgi:predicted aminopeptidase
VLNTFLGRSDAQLAGLLFHEIAHATLYAQGDTPFNESYATVVEEAGVRQWLQAIGRQDAWAVYARHMANEREILARLATLRGTLKTLYTSEATADSKRVQKATILKRFQRALAEDIKVRSELTPWRGWAEGDLNNANLAAVGVYWQWVETLQTRLATLGWPAFLDEMGILASLPSEQRQARLENLAEAGSLGRSAHDGPSPEGLDPSGPDPSGSDAR